MTFHGSARGWAQQPPREPKGFAPHLTLAVTPQLYSRGAGRGGGREALMRQRQPLRQLARGLVRRSPVKRHHGGGHAGAAAQLRPPPVADGRHLDLVHAPANGFFEAMNGHVCDVRVEKGSERRFYASPRRDQAKRDAKGASTARSARDRSRRAQKNISLSGSPQVLHVSSTGFPQVQYELIECAS
jgi:hypothetical protein